MKHLRLLFYFIVPALFVISGAIANNDEQPENVENTKVWSNQTVCPVMGGKIDSSSYTDIQGQRVYHCCDMCSKKLQDSPDKYFKDSFESGILFENIQKLCPVTGNKLQNKDSFSIYEGRRVYFCSNNCRDEFLKDPEKYLKILDDFTAEEKAQKFKGKVHNR